jgi:hypothetical protein
LINLLSVIRLLSAVLADPKSGSPRQGVSFAGMGVNIAGINIKVLYDKNQIILDFGDLITVGAILKIFSLNGNLKTAISLDGEKNFILRQMYFIPGFYFYTFQNKAENLSGRLIIIQE